MKRLLALAKRLWTEEPVIVRVGLSTAVSAGVLTATQASAIGDVIAGVVSVAGMIAARAKVTPASKDQPAVKPA